MAAGYAVSIWGLIFLLDLAWAGWQLKERGPAVARARLPAAVGFALTAAWMPVFSQGWFVLALAIIWGALAATLAAGWMLERAGERRRVSAPLALHAGWLTLAAFLDTAQTIVAQRWLDTGDMLEWSAVLIGLCGVLLLAANRALRGHPTYAAAGLWGLAAVYVKQSGWDLPGADTAAWLALALAVLMALQTAWLLWKRPRPG